ncbi:rna-directed dna polymerase from mobile element jockey-like [Pitangus sulphuratus]|nr:rna-directed dna polymerase from mobile element jockey-like [Pitangus sulphuratus]
MRHTEVRRLALFAIEALRYPPIPPRDPFPRGLHPPTQGLKTLAAMDSMLMAIVQSTPPSRLGEELQNMLQVWPVQTVQLAEVSESSALVLVGDFNIPDVYWELNTVEKRQSRRFLECIEDNFLLQLVNEPTRAGAPLYLLFTNREGLVGDVMAGGGLGHSDHEMTEFSTLSEVRKGINKTSTLDFRRAEFGLFRRLVQRVP